jgi:hypothetical protein
MVTFALLNVIDMAESAAQTRWRLEEMLPHGQESRARHVESNHPT